MSRGIHRLTDRQVQTAKPGRYADGKGLWLQVSAWTAADGSTKQTRCWLFQYTSPAGKIRQMGLGSVLTVRLAEARDLADNARRLLREGIDPIDAKHEKKRQQRVEHTRKTTFRAAAAQYIVSHKATWTNPKHVAQWTATLETYAYPIIGDVAVSDIDSDMILQILEPIWLDKPETASRLRGRIERILDRAKALKQRSGENPARWRGHLKEVFPTRSPVRTVRNHPALPYQQIGAFLSELRDRTGTSASALEFLILTAARTNEVLGAQIAEINLTDGIWTIPADRMKAGREHRIPLSKRAVELLRSLPHEDGNNFVFIGGRGKGLSNMSLLQIMRDARPDYVVHGFRSTFRDWAAETTAYPNEVAEMALAHTIKNKAESAYRRGDLFEKRRRLMEDWAGYCSLDASKTAEITYLHSRQK